MRIFHRVGLHHHLSCTLCRLNNISVRNEPSNDLAHYRQPLCGSVLEHRNPKSEIPGFDYSRAVAQRWLHGPEAVLKNLNLRTDLSSQNQFKKYLDLEYKQDKKEVFLETGPRWPNDPRWLWTNKQWREESLYVMVTNLFLKIIWKTAWERDEFWLADVCPDVLYKINREINIYIYIYIYI